MRRRNRAKETDCTAQIADTYKCMWVCRLLFAVQKLRKVRFKSDVIQRQKKLSHIMHIISYECCFWIDTTHIYTCRICWGLRLHSVPVFIRAFSCMCPKQPLSPLPHGQTPQHEYEYLAKERELLHHSMRVVTSRGVGCGVLCALPAPVTSLALLMCVENAYSRCGLYTTNTHKHTHTGWNSFIALNATFDGA